MALSTVSPARLSGPRPTWTRRTFSRFGFVRPLYATDCQRTTCVNLCGLFRHPWEGRRTVPRVGGCSRKTARRPAAKKRIKDEDTPLPSRAGPSDRDTIVWCRPEVLPIRARARGSQKRSQRLSGKSGLRGYPGSLVLAPKGRPRVARGVSPWKRGRDRAMLLRSPGGAARNRGDAWSSVAPPGLRRGPVASRSPVPGADAPGYSMPPLRGFPDSLSADGNVADAARATRRESHPSSRSTSGSSRAKSR